MGVRKRRQSGESSAALRRYTADRGKHSGKHGAWSKCTSCAGRRFCRVGRRQSRRRWWVRVPERSAGWYILSSSAPNFRDAVTAVRVPIQGNADAASLRLQPLGSTPRPVRVLTVCDILENRDIFTLQRVVIVGIFKSGMDETLRLDCPLQLVQAKSVGQAQSVSPALRSHQIRCATQLKRSARKLSKVVRRGRSPGRNASSACTGSLSPLRASRIPPVVAPRSKPFSRRRACSRHRTRPLDHPMTTTAEPIGGALAVFIAKLEELRSSLRSPEMERAFESAAAAAKALRR